ncbi:non-ribosomal peptide synthetase [Brevibacillus laterosporus]|uniref:non-ribosomal peptide synthetase n=1 Tax=Brevibacillus laterosporus TaxID=1465 RepID=UPI0018CE705F
MRVIILTVKYEYYPLSHPQKRIWYIEQTYPHTSMYNIGGIVRMHGSVDIAFLTQAIQIFIKKHDGLRLHLHEKEGDVNQYIVELNDFDVPFYDFSHSDQAEEEVLKWAEAEFTKPFVLIDHPLFSFATFRAHEKYTGYFVKLHHIIADGWSINIMTNQISNIYQKIKNGENISEEVEYSYVDLLHQEEKYVTSTRFEKNKKYWNDKFQSLPESFLSKSSDQVEGNRKTIDLDNDLSTRINEFATRHHLSLSSLFIMLTLLYQYKTQQNNDQILGIPVLNRSGNKEKNIFGMFTSSMPFRLKLEDTETLLALYKRVQNEVLSNFFHQRYPYDLLISNLELKKKGNDSLFQICVNYYGTKLVNELEGISIDNLEFYSGYQAYSLQLVIKEWSSENKITLFYDYKTSDYTNEQIEEIHDRLMYMLEQIIKQPEKLIKDISLLSDQEKYEHIYGRNQTDAFYPRDKVIHQLFEDQVRLTPDRVAVRFQDKTYTYRQLNEQANRLARTLRTKGIASDQFVSIYMRHSYEMIVGIWAVLKAGGAYVPIDPDFPLNRVSYILQDSQAKLLLSNADVNIEGFEGEVIRLDDPANYLSESHNLVNINQVSDLVYAIYTSGSTGKPKGTLIEHRGLVNYIHWAKQKYIQSQDETFALYSSLAFDLTVTSIFAPLLNGNQIIVYVENESEFVLDTILRENRVNILKLTPAHLALISDKDNHNSVIRRFIVGGEDLKATLAAKTYESFKGDISIYNEYGPTETVVGCMIYEYNPEINRMGSVPIGRPINNVQIYLLNDDLQPVPNGVTGELYISGDGVARGYLAREDLTKERFLDNPFKQGYRLYKTGDLARMLPSQDIEYAGRIDHQVKLRGYRIELGEIENCLTSFASVKEAVVIDRVEENGRKYLCAYMIADENISIVEMRLKLTNKLPSYMIPTYFVTIDKFLLTSNGKIDRNQLPDPLAINSVNQSGNKQPNDTEEIVMKIMKEVLQTNEVTVDSNFYFLGGDSIKAIQVVGKLNQMNLGATVRDIMTFPVVHELAAAIEMNQQPVAPQEAMSGAIKSTPITAWFFSQNLIEAQHWNQSVLLQLKKAFTIEQISKVLTKIVHHHDTLRLNYDPKAEALFYNDKHLAQTVDVETVDLSEIPFEKQLEQLKQIGEQVKRSFDLEQGLLFKAVLFQLGKGETRLLLTAHHLVIDGVSWRILLEDMGQLFRDIEEGRRLHLPAKTHSMQRWAEELEHYSKTGAFQYEQYWKEALETSALHHKTEAEECLANCETRNAAFTKESTDQLLYNANQAYQTHSHELLIMGVCLATATLMNETDIVIELEGHGREQLFSDIDVSRTIGWFTSMYPVRLQLPQGDIAHVIKHLKEQIRTVPNKGIDFGILTYLTGQFSQLPEKRIRFNFLGEVDNQVDNQFLTLAYEDTGSDISLQNPMTCLIEINAMIKEKRLHVALTYSKSNYHRVAMQQFLDNIITSTNDILKHCCQSEEIRDFTPSDFTTVTLTQDDLDDLFA